MSFDAFIGWLEKTAGVQGPLEPDADGVVHLACGELVVSLMEQDGCLLMMGPVCALPEDDGGRLAVDLLRGNFPGRPESDGVLSLSNDNMVCLHRRMPLEAAGEDELADGLEDFVVSLVGWRERVKNGPDGGEQPSERREDLRLDGFLRV